MLDGWNKVSVVSEQIIKNVYPEELLTTLDGTGVALPTITFLTEYGITHKEVMHITCLASPNHITVECFSTITFLL